MPIYVHRKRAGSEVVDGAASGTDGNGWMRWQGEHMDRIKISLEDMDQKISAVITAPRFSLNPANVYPDPHTEQAG